MARGATKSDAPVAAREQLGQRNDDTDPVTENLESAVTDQEKAQADQLKAGQNGVAKNGPTLAHNRTAAGESGNAGVQGGFIDQITRRDVNDCMEGHFCTVDGSNKDVDLPDGEDGYGVYVGPAATDKDGYPVTGTVRLHNSPQLLTVPYEAIRPAAVRGR